MWREKTGLDPKATQTEELQTWESWRSRTLTAQYRDRPGDPAQGAPGHWRGRRRRGVMARKQGEEPEEGRAT